MDKTTKKIGILGVGNLIVGDEGFGVHAVRYLEEHYEFPDNVLILDGGTAGIYMSPFLEECDPVLVIDVVDIDAEPGSMHYYSSEDVKAGKLSTRMSRMPGSSPKPTEASRKPLACRAQPRTSANTFATRHIPLFIHGDDPSLPRPCQFASSSPP